MTPDTELLQQLARLEYRLYGLRHASSHGRRLLLTGGTGTLGYAMVPHLLAAGFEITILSRDSHRQALMREQFPQLRFLLGDICDYDTMLEACLGQDVVIHAAAQKRVDIGETSVAEYMRVNVTGTSNVARAADALDVERALFISSDKAVQPLNFYGLTKAMGERLWTEQAYRPSGPRQRFSVVRYGNVMGSNGSVLHLWRKRLDAGLPISVRSPETTRFFMRPLDAVDMVLQALTLMQGGEIFVPQQTQAFALHDLANAVEPNHANWQLAPLGPREKIHEWLMAPGEYYEEASATLYRIWPQRSGAYDLPATMCSGTAPRLSGDTVVKLLEA